MLDSIGAVYIGASFMAVLMLAVSIPLVLWSDCKKAAPHQAKCLYCGMSGLDVFNEAVALRVDPAAVTCCDDLVIYWAGEPPELAAAEQGEDDLEYLRRTRW